MLYHYDDIVIIDPGTGSLAWTKRDAAEPRVDSGFGWVEEDTLVLVRDASGRPQGVAEDRPDSLPLWNRTRRVCFAA